MLMKSNCATRTLDIDGAAMGHAIALMILSGVLGALCVPIVALAFGAFGIVAPFEVAWRGHVVEVRKWHVRYIRCSA